MSDAQQPPGDGSGAGSGEPVGSVGEEAAKLFGALSGWAREQSREQAHDAAGDWGEALAHGLHEVGEHVATGSADCRWCPVCQVIHVVRQTSPEVRAHLTSAAGSLMQAAAALLASPTPGGSGARGPVERIDLDETDPWDEPEGGER